jgi:hypothetical protein
MRGLVHHDFLDMAKSRAKSVGQKQIPTLKAADVHLPPNMKPWGTQP